MLAANEAAPGSEGVHLGWLLPERIYQFAVIAAVARRSSARADFERRQ